MLPSLHCNPTLPINGVVEHATSPTRLWKLLLLISDGGTIEEKDEWEQLKNRDLAASVRLGGENEKEKEVIEAILFLSALSENWEGQVWSLKKASKRDNIENKC